MAIVEFAVLPAVSEDRINEIVDMAIEVVKTSGLTYEVGANGTTVEGDLRQVIEVVLRAHEVAKDKGSGRVFTVIKIDDRVEGITIKEKLSNYRNS